MSVCVWYLVYKDDTGERILGKFYTNHSITVDEALEILDIDMDTYAQENGWHCWDWNCLDIRLEKEVSKMNLTSLYNLDDEELTEEEFEELQEHELVKSMENLGYSASHLGCQWWNVELEDGDCIDVFTRIV